MRLKFVFVIYLAGFILIASGIFVMAAGIVFSVNLDS